MSTPGFETPPEVGQQAGSSQPETTAPRPTGDALRPANAKVSAGPRRGRGGRRKRQRDDIMVPQARFDSYYGRQIVKPAPWKHEIPLYFYLGGLAAGSGLLGAGAEMTGRTTLQRNTRLVSLAAVAGSGVALISDLGKPSRFYNMLRTVKLTSPMSVGTWIFSGFSAFSGLAGVSELAKFVAPTALTTSLPWRVTDRVTGLGTGMFAPPLAAYTAVLLSDTATPTWHEGYRELPFVFVGSALAASGGMAMVTSPVAQTAPARRFALGGSILELGAHRLLEKRLGLLAEPMHTGHAGTLLKIAQACTMGGALLTAVGGRFRPTAALAGLALNAGSALTRFGIVEAGIASAKDPKYTVIPQRERIERRTKDAQQAARSDATARPPL